MFLGLFNSCGEWGPVSSCSTQASHCGGFFCCGTRALGHMGFSNCNTWTQKLQFLDSRARAQKSWHTGLASLRHVGSSWNRDESSVSGICGQILQYRTTRKASEDFQMWKQKLRSHYKRKKWETRLNKSRRHIKSYRIVNPYDEL